MRIWAIIGLACLVCSCASKQAEIMPECPGAHVILPGNFIIDLAADSQVQLNPAIQEFALFCRPEDAQKALEAERQSLPPGSDWRVYRLEGKFSELAASCHNGRYCLKTPAVVTDWVEIR